MQKINRLFLLTSALVALTNLFSGSVYADTIYTRDHRAWKGLVVAENTQDVWLDLGFDIAVIPRQKIVVIKRSDPKTTNFLRSSLQANRQHRNHLLVARKRQPKEIPFISHEGHVLVDAVLNDHVKARLLLDTGSTFTFLSPEIGRALGIPTDNSGRSAEVFLSDGRKKRMLIATLGSLQVSDATAYGVQVAILPDSGEKMPFADGLLGISFLSHYNFKIDNQHSKIILEPIEPKNNKKEL